MKNNHAMTLSLILAATMLAGGCCCSKSSNGRTDAEGFTYMEKVIV